MRIGLAGAGRIGAFRAEILSGLPTADSVVVADADAARAGAYRAELAAFVESAEHGGQRNAAMSDALEAFYIAEACELSRARHEPVAVAEVRR